MLPRPSQRETNVRLSTVSDTNINFNGGGYNGGGFRSNNNLGTLALLALLLSRQQPQVGLGGFSGIGQILTNPYLNRIILNSQLGGLGRFGQGVQLGGLGKKK
ncbi:hypothetical protein Ddc_19211 [Ditylenchus destructor]|nr:hypothetical protein Ddc_19211 [Ditylenchus destructor]